MPSKTKRDEIQMPGEIGTIAIAKLLPSKTNPRFHSENNVAKIAQSIKTYGWTTPVLISDSGEVIAGHGRLLAAKQLGMTDVPFIKLSHLTPQLIEAYRIADNRLALDSEWDEELLNTVLANLANTDFDLSLTGFDELEISSRLALTNSDANDEWQGMPEFNQKDKMAYRTVYVHFKNDEDVQAFAELLDAKITENTKYIWYPKAEVENYADKRFAATAENES